MQNEVELHFFHQESIIKYQQKEKNFFFIKKFLHQLEHQVELIV
jgi:hypothetical protein